MMQIPTNNSMGLSLVSIHLELQSLRGGVFVVTWIVFFWLNLMLNRWDEYLYF